jgi:hypothetical protein
MNKFAPHATLQTEIGKGGNVEKRATHTTEKSQKRIGETLEKQGILNTRRRRVTFILDCFPVSGEGE